MTRLNPYINFEGNTREAMEFYRMVFGGELTMNTYKEFNASQSPDEDNKIMHSALEVKDGVMFMAADVPSGMKYQLGTNISITLSGEDEEELRGYWEGLSDGATIEEPLVKAPWGDTFGMLTDKFGIHWMVNIAGPKA